MLRHLLRLMWNRKRANLLLMLEVLLSFLVMFTVLAGGLYLLDLYRQPRGFDPERVWSVEIGRTQGGAELDWTAADSERLARLMTEVAILEPVTAVAAATNRPYSHSTSRHGWEQQGRQHLADVARATDDLPRVLGIRLVQGRWFTPADGALAWEPVVITQDLAAELFATEDPLNQRVGSDSAKEEADEPERRVVGVIEPYRNGGELTEPAAFVFSRIDLRQAQPFGPRHLLVKVAPGTTAAFEEPLLERLQAVDPAWTFTVRRLTAERARAFQEKLLPLGLAGVVGGFMLLMVVLGLTGIMWQNVTRRTRELGLRRAVGASRADVHRQIVAEVMVIASFGLALGALLVLQLPVLPPMAFLPFGVVLAATLMGALMMLLLAAGCGLYPGWSATRIQPAEALHYE